MKGFTFTENKHQKRLFIKVGFIIILILLMLIPNGLVMNLIYERNGLSYEVKNEVSQSWGQAQHIKGPLLSIPYKKKILTDNKEIIIEKTFHLLPQNLKYSSDLKTQVKRRSIYEVLLYNAEIICDVSFQLPNFNKIDEDIEEIQYEKAHISMGISDPHGIKKMIYIAYNSKRLQMSSGTFSPETLSKGVSSKFPLSKEDVNIQFSLTINLNGSDGIYFYPIAGNTSLNLAADWGSPSFTGNILPLNSEIQEKEFTAEWSASEYNRGTPGFWVGNQYTLNHLNESLGVKLINTVDQYTQNIRSAKYSLLIITLTFGIFFFFETVFNSRVHPIQYIFIGLSLSLFYFLLLSISEHLGFNWAYFIAAYATSSMITAYSYFILKEGNKVLILAAILIGIYTYIFILLQLEDYALLVGSIGLFAILTAVMFLSRNIDWYSLGSEEKEANFAKI